MRKNKRESLPEEFKNIEEAAKFWDTHSLADYEDLQRDIEFEVELKSEKNYFAVEKELSDHIDKLAHIIGSYGQEITDAQNERHSTPRVSSVEQYSDSQLRLAARNASRCYSTCRTTGQQPSPHFKEMKEGDNGMRLTSTTNYKFVTPFSSPWISPRRDTEKNQAAYIYLISVPQCLSVVKGITNLRTAVIKWNCRHIDNAETKPL